MKTRLLFAVASLLVLAVGPMTAQPGQGIMRGRQMDRLEEFKKIRLMEFLNLEEETAVRFFSRYGNHQDEIRSIVERRSEAIDRLYRNMRKDDDNVDYAKFIDETLSMEREIIETRSKFLKSLEGLLTKRQIAQYVVFERRFNQNVREMLMEMNQQRMRR